MEPRISPSSQPNLADSKGLKIIQWEDLEQELARLWSLSSALKEAEDKKSSLKEKLESLIQVQAKSLSRSNKLEEMQDKLEARKLVMGDMLMDSKCESVNAKKKEEQLGGDVRLLLVAGANLSAANKKLQEDNASLSGKRGYEHLKSLQKTIGKRQQYMISQVSFLYPVKAFVERGHELELESFLNGVRSGNPSGSKRLNEGALSISGLQLTMLSFTKMSFFTDKKVVQRSATALGYAAHAVFLIASYLKVHLRYPLCLGGSRSYVADPAPPVEPNSYDLPSSSVNATYMKTIEFPLFLEGQDRTRAAYGVFLLNKDLEQLLNFVGVNSLGPRHVLANLKELLRTILSAEYKDR